MQIDEIRANAPDGATHYVDAAGIGVVYIKYSDGIGYYWHSVVKMWIKCNPHLEEIKPLH